MLLAMHVNTSSFGVRGKLENIPQRAASERAIAGAHLCGAPPEVQLWDHLTRLIPLVESGEVLARNSESVGRAHYDFVECHCESGSIEEPRHAVRVVRRCARTPHHARMHAV